jgi:acyl-CoA synthetase (AMP-forming)/AMP-acid ligase II
MSPGELNWILRHGDVAGVITHAGHAALLAAAVPDGIRPALVDALPNAPAAAPAAAPGEAALIYTSGTTGQPKGCILGNDYFLQCGRHYLDIGGLCTLRPRAERLITPLPVTHMNALCVSFTTMVLGANCLVQLDRFHPSSWWTSVRDSRATCFHYLGVMPAMLLGAPASAADDLRGRVNFGFGAGVDPRHHAAFEARFGVPLVEAWAMTETGGGAWITASEEPRHVGSRCFGRAPAGLEWRLVGEDGTEVAAGDPGELLVRRSGADARAGFFAGYYKDAAATEAAWEGGWFHTGDVVRVGDDGSFYFVDRRKNVIRRSGENIAAVEVESALQLHPGVLACAVAAVGDDVRGEEVLAFIVPRPGVTADAGLAASIQAHCLSALVYFKAPGWVAFVDSLPQTPSQKLARGEIKRRAGAAVDSGAALDLRAGKRRTGAAAH